MGLIKSSNPAARSAAPFSLRDVEAHARLILQQARQQADAVLAGVQREADAMCEAARRQGFDQGRVEGLQQGLEQGRKQGHDAVIAQHGPALSEAVKAVSAVLREVEAAQQQLLSTGLRDVVELALAVASRITRRQGAIDPGVLEANLAEVMRLVVHASDIRVAIHPAQRQVLREVLPRLGVSFPTLQHAEILDDATLSPGGCRVFTRHGQIDADLNAQLDRITRDLLPDTTDELLDGSAT